MTAVGTTSENQAPAASRLSPGMMLGEYRLGPPLWSLRIADAYRAEGPKGPATVYVIHAKVAAHAGVRDELITGTRAAAALPEHTHLVHTIAAGLTGDVLWIATEEVDGQPVKDLLAKKRLGSGRPGSAGLGARATSNLVTGISAALADVPHGALAEESVVVNRTGRVRVIDLALGRGTAAAMVAGLIPRAATVAPEVLAGGAPTSAGDVFSLGSLMYECLTGTPLERGGGRPSELVPEASAEIDDLIVRACSKDPDKRFGRIEVIGELVEELLGRASTSSIPTSVGPPPPEAPSLAASLSSPGMAAAGGAVVDRVLAAALADTTEKWLVSKGKLDHGPFSLADVMAQIEKGDIVAGNMIMDKDTGARVDVGEHPLLAPLVESSRQRRDDARRAQAEVAVQRTEKKRGALLYGVIAAGVIGAALAVYFIIQAASRDSGAKQVATMERLEGASLKVTVTMPKAPARKAGGRRSGGGGGGGGGGDNTRGSEDLSLDMSDEGDGGGGTLDMNTVYGVYSKQGGALGGCLQRTGAGSASIAIIIDGPSGKVTFVKVDGKQAGGTWSCINGVMRSMKFPTLASGRTRAEFDIGI